MLSRIVGVAALVLAGLLVAQHLSSQEPSYADGPLPSVRDVLGCDGRVYASQQVPRRERGFPQDTAAGAVQSGLYAIDQWWVPTDAFHVAYRKQDRQILTFDAGGRSRLAALVQSVRSPRSGGWWLTAWAMCAPSELIGTQGDRLAYGVWLDTRGRPVPTSIVMTVRGAERCDQEDLTFVRLYRSQPDRRRVYVGDHAGKLADRLLTTYSAHARLPGDARDSGWRRGGRALWLRPHGDAAYLVNLADPGDVQRWPLARRYVGCS